MAVPPPAGLSESTRAQVTAACLVECLLLASFHALGSGYGYVHVHMHTGHFSERPAAVLSIWSESWHFRE